MGQHIPGRPTIVVENMPGAGSMNAANYVFVLAPKDGTIIAAVDYTAPMHKSLGGSADFVSAPSAIGRAYWVAPDVPADRLTILRAAFDAAAQDSELLQETAKLGGAIRPQSGAEIAAQVKRVADTPQIVLDRMDRMLHAQN